VTDLRYSDGIAGARTMLALEANPAALQRRLPNGWELSPYAGEDLRRVRIDRSSVRGSIPPGRRLHDHSLRREPRRCRPRRRGTLVRADGPLHSLDEPLRSDLRGATHTRRGRLPRPHLHERIDDGGPRWCRLGSSLRRPPDVGHLPRVTRGRRPAATSGRHHSGVRGRPARGAGRSRRSRPRQGTGGPHSLRARPSRPSSRQLHPPAPGPTRCRP
jgi:hypothetical protein